jgi:hypothetical protein
MNGPVFRPVDRHGNVGEVALRWAAVALVVKRAVVRAALAEGMTMAAGHCCVLLNRPASARWRA